MRIKVKIKPNSSQNTLTIMDDGTLLIKIKAAPIKGQANSEMIKLLAKYYKIPQKNINIIHGQTAKTKLIEIIN